MKPQNYEIMKDYTTRIFVFLKKSPRATLQGFHDNSERTVPYSFTNFKVLTAFVDFTVTK